VEEVTMKTARLATLATLVGIAFLGFSSTVTPAAAFCNAEECGYEDLLVDSYCESFDNGFVCSYVYDRYVVGCDPHPIQPGMCRMTYPNSGVFVCDHGPECYDHQWQINCFSGGGCYGSP
jgi:hypothetical protein